MRPSSPRGGGAARLHHRIRASEAGMVTAELAIAIMAVMPLVLSVVAIAGVASLHVRVVENARTAARLLARGEAESDVRARVHDQLPDAGLDLITTPDDARVVVTQPIRPLGLLPAFTVRGVAVTPLEGVDAS